MHPFIHLAMLTNPSTFVCWFFGWSLEYCCHGLNFIEGLDVSLRVPLLPCHCGVIMIPPLMNSVVFIARTLENFCKGGNQRLQQGN
jgi:hypothetical protein